MRINFRDKKFWIIFGASVIVALAILFTVLYFVDINRKIDTPTNLSAYHTSTGEIYVQVDENSDALNYEFVVTKSEDIVRTFVSENNVIEISSFVNLGGDYSIKCKLLGKTEASNSNYCEIINYTNNIQISAPTIHFNNDRTQLVFEIEDNYSESITLEFVLYYKVSDSGEFSTYDTFSIITNDTHEAIVGYFDFSSSSAFLSLLENGEYSLGVNASCSNNDYYLTSYLSDQITYLVAK